MVPGRAYIQAVKNLYDTLCLIDANAGSREAEGFVEEELYRMARIAAAGKNK